MRRVLRSIRRGRRCERRRNHRLELREDADDLSLGASQRADADLLLGYYDAVHEQTLQYLDRIGEDDLDAIVDRRWDPPVTLGVRLISIADDDLQHSGQAGYVRGLIGH